MTTTKLHGEDFESAWLGEVKLGGDGLQHLEEKIKSLSKGLICLICLGILWELTTGADYGGKCGLCGLTVERIQVRFRF